MFDPILRQNLYAIAKAYAKATGKSMATVSKQFYQNADFFDKIRAGECSITSLRLHRMLDQFRKEWPPKTPWPATRMISMGMEPQE
jgi:hypothetical protein